MRRLFIFWAYFLGTFAWAQSVPDVLPDAASTPSFQNRVPAMNLIQDEKEEELREKQEQEVRSINEPIIDAQEAKRVEEVYEKAPSF